MILYHDLIPYGMSYTGMEQYHNNSLNSLTSIWVLQRQNEENE